VAALGLEDLLAAIGRARGLVRAGARVDLQKAAEVVLNDFRNTALGRITLETPDQLAAWVAAAEIDEAGRAARKAERNLR